MASNSLPTQLQLERAVKEADEELAGASAVRQERCGVPTGRATMLAHPFQWYALNRLHGTKSRSLGQCRPGRASGIGRAKDAGRCGSAAS